MVILNWLLQNKMRTLFYSVLIALAILLCPYPGYGYFVLNSYTEGSENNELHHYSGIVSYIINLDRAKNRYGYVKDKVYSLGYKTVRISAVDGALLSKEEIELKTDEKYKFIAMHSPELGTIGCYLSHLKTWKSFLKSDEEFALIFEDDVSFDPKILKETIEQLRNEKKIWDIVTFERNRSPITLPIKTLDKTHNELSVYLSGAFNSGAYLVNRNAARKLVSKAIPIKLPLDKYFTRSWEFDIKFT